MADAQAHRRPEKKQKLHHECFPEGVAVSQDRSKFVCFKSSITTATFSDQMKQVKSPSKEKNVKKQIGPKQGQKNGTKRHSSAEGVWKNRESRKNEAKQICTAIFERIFYFLYK